MTHRFHFACQFQWICNGHLKKDSEAQGKWENTVIKLAMSAIGMEVMMSCRCLDLSLKSICLAMPSRHSVKLRIKHGICFFCRMEASGPSDVDKFLPFLPRQRPSLDVELILKLLNLDFPS